MVKNGQKWSKMVKKSIKNGQKWSKKYTFLAIYVDTLVICHLTIIYHWLLSSYGIYDNINYGND
jgi:hypothetical protein